MNREQYISGPNVSQSYRIGWEGMKKHFLEFLLVTLIVAAIGSLSSVFSAGGFGNGAWSLLVGVFISGPISFGVSYFYLKAMRGEHFEVSDIFQPFRENYLQVIFASFLYMVLIVFGFFLLIIPGFIIAIRLSFVPYLVMDEGLEPVEAIKSSWEMTRDFAWDIFAFGIIGFFIILAGIICFLVGVLPALMMLNASFASFYLSVRDEFEMYPLDEEE